MFCLNGHHWRKPHFAAISRRKLEVTWWMEHSQYFFLLANGAGAMNSYCRELLSPQTGMAALTLTVMKGFEAKIEWFPYILPISIYSAYSSILRIRTSGGSRTRVRWFAVRRSNHYTTQLVPTKRQNVVFKPNVWKMQCLHSQEKKILQMFHSPSHFEGN